MSSERHPSSYVPSHRPKRGNKTVRAKRGQNSGSKFDHQHARNARLKLRQLREEQE